MISKIKCFFNKHEYIAYKYKNNMIADECKDTFAYTIQCKRCGKILNDTTIYKNEGHSLLTKWKWFNQYNPYICGIFEDYEDQHILDKYPVHDKSMDLLFIKDK